MYTVQDILIKHVYHKATKKSLNIFKYADGKGKYKGPLLI